MKVLDCNECGETITAANDAELVRCVEKHFSDKHEALEHESAEELVAEEAYEAMDS